jgi:hypothetical protein
MNELEKSGTGNTAVRTAVRFAFDKRHLPTWPFEVAPITDVPVRAVTLGAQVISRRRDLRSTDSWSRYRLTCRSCARQWSIEAKLSGFSCTVLFDHPSVKCTCGESSNGLRHLGWVEE